jgi:hypothetical protein
MTHILKYLCLFLTCNSLSTGQSVSKDSIDTSTDPIQYTAIADSYIQQRDFDRANKYITIAKIYSTYDLFRLQDPSAVRDGNPQEPIWNAIDPWLISHPIKYRNGLLEALTFVNENPPTHDPLWLTENSLSVMVGDSPLKDPTEWELIWKQTLQEFEIIAYNEEYWKSIEKIIQDNPQKILSGYAYKILADLQEPADLKEQFNATIKAAYETKEFKQDQLQLSIQLIKFMQMQWITQQGIPQITTTNP